MIELYRFVHLQILLLYLMTQLWFYWNLHSPLTTWWICLLWPGTLWPLEGPESVFSYSFCRSNVTFTTAKCYNWNISTMVVSIDQLISPSGSRRYTKMEFSALTVAGLRTHPEKYALQMKFAKNTQTLDLTKGERDWRFQAAFKQKSRLSRQYLKKRLRRVKG